MKRRFTQLGLALAVMAMLIGQPEPAHALSIGGGQFDGVITVNPTIPAFGPCIATNYTWASTAQTLSIGSPDGPAVFNGLVDTTANGGSSCENTDGGIGTINVTACNYITGVGLPSNNISCALSGWFERTGPLLVWHLFGSFTIGTVVVPVGEYIGIGEFVPTNAGTVFGSTVTANFGGIFYFLD